MIRPYRLIFGFALATSVAACLSGCLPTGDGLSGSPMSRHTGRTQSYSREIQRPAGPLWEYRPTPEPVQSSGVTTEQLLRGVQQEMSLQPKR